MKLIEALEALKQAPTPPSAVLQVRLVCGFTPLHLQAFLEAHLRHELPSHEIAMRTGLFGDLLGNLRRLEEDRCEAAAVVIEWEDLDPRLGIRRLGGWRPALLPDIVQTARRSIKALEGLLERLGRKATVALSLPTLPLPPIAFTSSSQSSEFENALDEMITVFKVCASRFDGVRVVNARRLERISPLYSRHDVKSELSAGLPYTLAHADALASLLARLIHNPVPKKGLITDLDDTLWRGILGEVNVEGIAWDLDHHAQRYGLYQQLLASLADAGTLVAVASKNDPALVEEAFRTAKPVLRRESIFPLEANWGPKSESVARVLRAWNIDASSVVFVDDSALDLAEVKAAHPGIECRLFPREDDAAAYQLLGELRDLFGKECVSAEDEIRLQSIRASQSAEQNGELHGASQEQFLQEANGKLTVGFSDGGANARALELINKTNQFNLNGKRQTGTSWREYLGDPSKILLVAAYEDRFGPLGKIAVVAGRVSGRQLKVDHWVMSCRAFSRRIEHACLLHLFRKLELERIHFDFVATARNGPLQSFFEDCLGFAPTGAISIAREQFLQRCAPVYLRIEERDERH